ncbi:fumarylacetoacetate hydrolase family protein [Propionibacteriaceae bacterium Y2011]|uniref:fumarylacetoacetate hydrolase family protein n=1 Tax=Microlunatus sp. Y2014 TaxID=3418488 RepID=UPI003B46CAA1
MRFVRLGPVGQERDAVLVDDRHAAWLPPSGVGDAFDLDDLRSRGALALESERSVPLADHRIGAPLRPGKIICVGLNYADHAAEGGQEAPTEPILFLKVPDTVVGPHDPVVIPRGGDKTDWEVELGVVIGRRCAYLADEAEAMAHVAGYVLCNDVSERHFQLERGGQWDKGKNCATFCPMGPWFLTADEVPDPQRIRLGLAVDDHTYQDSSTAEMIFGVARLVHEISQFMTLYPGDVISTGTPAGVGAGQQPPRYLAAGQTMHVWADGLGRHASPVVTAD